MPMTETPRRKRYVLSVVVSPDDIAAIDGIAARKYTEGALPTQRNSRNRSVTARHALRLGLAALDSELKAAGK